ncbi:hypothetical protein B0A55_02522 [Friedmanniomyces simplex]|uniref:F-box domain-containing protein n=1 Tax=Friedmanniomyces simplex TaxID=329884 RepID=A0A4V5NHH7_9PEZI|nr:hypothetical protein B0A55_02522 [Friedmanniomyces simplex]
MTENPPPALTAHSQQSTTFFTLPRELRDVIYTLALVEPPKWERRHQPNCPLLDPSRSWQWPVYRSTHETVTEGFLSRHGLDGWRSPLELFTDSNPLTQSQVESCYAAGCHGPAGTSLRLANRQIHEESEEVFWTKNVFCFENPQLMVHHLTLCVQKGGKNKKKIKDAQMLDTCATPCMPITAKGKTRRLSALQLGKPDEFDLSYSEMSGVVFALHKVPNLLEVKLPSRLLVRHLKNFAQLRLPNLRFIRAGHLEDVLVGEPRVKARVDVYMSKAVTLPLCLWNSHGEGRRPSTCYACWVALGREMDKVLEPWLQPWRHLGVGGDTVGWCIAGVLERLGKHVPVQSLHDRPFEMKVRLPGGGREVVKVFGLPVSRGAMRRLKKEMKRMCAEPVERRVTESNSRFEPADDDRVALGRINKPVTEAQGRSPVTQAPTRNQVPPEELEEGKQITLRQRRHGDYVLVEVHRRKSSVGTGDDGLVRAMDRLVLARKAAREEDAK